MFIVWLFQLSAIAPLVWGQNLSTPCNQEILDRSFVTQCDPVRCEQLLEPGSDEKRPSEWPKTKDEVIHIVSSRKGDRFVVNKYNATDNVIHYYEESHPHGVIFVDTDVMYQRILGFGTTLTDASCTNVDDLPEEIRAVLINDYFSPEEGIGLNLIKTPIGSTKYSFTNYVLDQPDNSNLELSSYDTDHRIPLIRDVMKAAGKLKNRIKILASSGTAPGEYKDNNRMIHGGLLLDDKIDGYASYLTSYVAAYKAQDLNIWSLILSESPATVALDKGVNETLDYCSMAMRPSDTVKLVKAITDRRAQRSDVDSFRLLMLGDNRAFAPVWADTVLSSPEVNRNIAGLAYICDDDKASPYDNLVYVTKRYPNKYLLATQGSVNTPVKLGSWQYAENYATEIIKNLEYGSVGWVDFNMALNLQGGPVLNSRYKADAPVMIDPKKGVFYRNPMFYAIGHLSRYVKPGSVRVKSQFASSAHMYASQHISFVTPDNYLVVVVSNNNIGPMPVIIAVNTRTKVEALLQTKSFNTFIFRLK